MNPQYCKPICPVIYGLDEGLGRKISHEILYILRIKCCLDTAVFENSLIKFLVYLHIM